MGLFETAVGLGAAGAAALAVFLAWSSGPVGGARLLALFVAGNAVGLASPVAVSLFGPAAEPAALVAAATSPLAAAVFLHFAATFAGGAGTARTGRLMAAGYGLAALGVAAGLAMGFGRFVPWQGAGALFQPELGGWLAIATTAVLAATGHAYLALALPGAEPQRRRQIVAILLAALTGLAGTCGLLFPALDIRAAPWPLLLLPLYPPILVYGVLRYELMAVNPWARRALAWGLVLLALAALAGGVAALGLGGWPLADGLATWLAMTVGLLAAALLVRPMTALADRLVFPGHRVSESDRRDWAARLAAAGDWPALVETAQVLLSAHLRLAVGMTVDPGGAPVSAGLAEARPCIQCRRLADGWTGDLVGWQQAPPGPRQVAALFALTLVEAARRLESIETRAAARAAERRQAWLAELGALAATVAHDLRNPLNNIRMAAATAPPDLRAEVDTQAGRMDALIRDLLDYAGAWSVDPEPFPLKDEIDLIVAGFPRTRVDNAVPAELILRVDARKMRRALTNLVDNAVAAAGEEAAQIAIAAVSDEVGAVRLDIRDRGDGVPASIRDRLFQPFISNRPTGTGLGLAIVQRVVEAHGGQIALVTGEESPGWSTCFRITLPSQVC